MKFSLFLQLTVTDGDGLESTTVTVKVEIIPVNDNPPVINTDGNRTLFVEGMAAVAIVGQDAAITDADQFLDHIMIRKVQVRTLNATNGEVSYLCSSRCSSFCENAVTHVIV